MMSGGVKVSQSGEMWFVQDHDFEDIINLTSLRI